MSKILFVVTGSDHWTLADGSEHPTGYWAEEVIAPYRAFKSAGYEIVVATPGGVVPTLDQASLAPEFNGGEQGAADMRSALDDAEELTRPIPLEDVAVGDYAAVFYPGGHGPMEDLSVDKNSARVLLETLASGRPLAVVCHAPAALLATVDDDGRSPFDGYRLTAFTDAEERTTGLADNAKWLLQDRLVRLDIDFREETAWSPHVEVDRGLFTGQNPASAGPLADEVLAALA
ncbi:type 1 glutamine amidotransferase domain-containing protein [Nocardia callitridis]|uniref:Type 1 glutamine amidotransferase domain-containing protein n=1 Tax=Nocardia callitridis TaxID=648753 RepID=A0ABP9K3X9_9NOCA